MAAPAKTAKLTLPDGRSANLPVVVGTENEHAVDIRSLRADTAPPRRTSAPAPHARREARLS